MAKALMGHLPTDLRTPHHLVTDNAKLRARVAELTELVGSLKAENDTLVARVGRAGRGLDGRDGAPARLTPSARRA